MTTKTIMLTGVSGVLGNSLVQHILKETNYNVLGITGSVTLMKERYSNDRVVFLDREYWYEEIDGTIKIDTFINCGFPRTSDPTLLAEGLETVIDLMEKVILLDVKNVINISSQSVYSQTKEIPATETTRVCPQNLYGMTKFATEQLISAMLKNEENINYTHIRLGSLVSLEFKNRMTYQFVEKAIKGKPIIVSSKNINLSYLHVNDATRALIKLLLSSNNKWSEIYNLGSNESYLAQDIATKTKKILHDKKSISTEIILKNEDVLHNNVIDSNLFYNEFNWKPIIDIETILLESYNNIILDSNNII